MKAVIILAATLAAAPPSLAPLALPGAEGPIGFDDLRFSVELHKVLVPAGRTGRLDLVDPETRAVDAIGGFSSSHTGGWGHSQSTTSADSGLGLVFASDRTQHVLFVVDPSAKAIVAYATLTGSPDYVRWVASTREVWVTEPERKVIETFRIERGTPLQAVRTGTIHVPDGPEALEIDAARHRAYTNTWHDQTVAIDVDSRRIVASWKNGCAASRGIALDAESGLVFAACDEGKVVALDPVRSGSVAGQVQSGEGVDGLGYDARLSHLYVPGGDSADLTVVGVGPSGTMQVLGRISTAQDAHCVTADDVGNVYVCDPAHGRLLTFRDPYPASRQRRSARTGR